MAQVTRVAVFERVPAAGLIAGARDYGITVLVALVVFFLAYDNGGYDESTRDTLAIAVWWLVILGIAFRLWPLVRIRLGAVVTGALLAAFGCFTLLSVFWSSDAAAAYAEFTRVSLYVGVFTLAVVSARRDDVGRWCDGMALGIAGVMIVALISRFFPHTLEQREIAQLLGGAQTRLSFPLGYWNGLGILMGIGIPLLLRAAVTGANALTRGLAVAPLPGIVAVLYLTSSRGGIATAAIATIAFLLLTGRRWTALAAVTVAGAGAAAAVLALVNRDALVNGPLDGALAESQGRSATLIIGGVCVLTALIFAVGSKAVPGRHAISPLAGWLLSGALIVLAVIGIARAHPIQRFEAFKQPPTYGHSGSLIQQHLLSKSGNGRWQLWSSAIDEFKSKPTAGHGAGSFQSWWLQHGSLPTFVQDAHSLYAETLGELGIIGLLLLVGAFLSALVVAAGRLVRSGDAERATVAALVATFASFAVGASADWMWELTVVSVVAFVALGLAVGPATAHVPRRPIADPGQHAPRSMFTRYAAGAAVIIGGCLLICAIAIPLVAATKVRDSQRAVAREDYAAALEDALDARRIQPWASAAYLQAALVEERAGDYGAARRWIARAIRRDKHDWQLWYVASRIQTNDGAIRQAVRSFNRAKALNPRSPIFQNG